jgi:hypothetical protein
MYYSASHSTVAPENVGLHLHVIPVRNAVVTGGAGNVLLYVQCTLDLLQLFSKCICYLQASMASMFVYCMQYKYDITRSSSNNLDNLFSSLSYKSQGLYLQSTSNTRSYQIASNVSNVTMSTFSNTQN